MPSTPDAAWHDPATRQAWRSYRTGGLRWLVGGVLGVVLLVLVTTFAVSASRTLLEQGQRARGEVVSVAERSLSFAFDADGTRHTVTLDVSSGRVYTVGEPVQVRYDADDPEVARLVDEPRQVRFLGPVWVALVVGSAVALVIGAGASLRALRWARVLRATPWRPVRVRTGGDRLWLTPPGGQPVEARLRSTTRWRRAAVTGTDGHEIWAAIDGSELVLRLDGADTLYGARTV